MQGMTKRKLICSVMKHTGFIVKKTQWENSKLPVQMKLEGLEALVARVFPVLWCHRTFLANLRYWKLPPTSSLLHWYSAGLRFVEAPGQQCYRKVVDVMIISTMHSICFNSKVKECSCCTNNTCLSYCLQTRHVSTLRAKSAMISISVLKMNVYHCSWWP